jgi:hypothetical protein
VDGEPSDDTDSDDDDDEANRKGAEMNFALPFRARAEGTVPVHASLVDGKKPQSRVKHMVERWQTRT